MSLSPRAAASRTLSTLPVYRVLPPSTVRTAAALRYHAHRGSPAEVVDAEAIRGGRVSPRYYSTAMVAARAAFRAGQDDVLEQTLTDLEAHHPDAAPVHEIWSDLAAYRGDAEVALARAERARLLNPAAAQAWSRLVRLTYRARGSEEGDRVAVQAVTRFPTSAPVLWAVGKTCVTPEQYERLLAAWRGLDLPPDALLVAVRALATAAARAGLVNEAIDLYAEAIAAFAAHRGEPVEPAQETRLAGRGAWRAIADLVEVLDDAGVPFFLAAGTALGLIREGRPLDLDGDIDVGVLDRDFDEAALRDLFARDPRFDFDVAHPSTRKVALRHRGGSPVDIFRFYEEGGHWWHDAVFVRWHNAPFEVRRRDLGGLSLPLPADEDAYLIENYGPDWRTPDAGFDAFTDDAPNVEVTWPEYLELHLVRRAYRRLTAGDRDAAIADLETANRPALADPLRAGATPTAPVTTPTATDPGGDTGAAAPPPRRMTVADADEVVAAARRAREEGRRDDAVELLRDTVRGGGWRFGRLWGELVALMASPADYGPIRDLWVVSEPSAHRNAAVLRSVARAAVIAGEHEEARALLRRAIRHEAETRRRLRARLGRARGAVRERLAARRRDDDAEASAAFAAKAATALEELNRVLDDLGVQAFLISGTLLGYVREADFIAWDKDIDVGVFADQVDAAKLEETFERAPSFTVRRLDFTTDRLRVDHANGVMIDVFPHYLDDDGKVWHDGTATRWWNSPFELKTVEFLGVEQAVPEVPERYLDENYGNWRVPDPHFDARFDAPNLEVTDEAFRDTLVYFDLLRAVRQGQRRKRERYRQMLRDRGEGPWLDRL